MRKASTSEIKSRITHCAAQKLGYTMQRLIKAKIKLLFRLSSLLQTFFMFLKHLYSLLGDLLKQTHSSNRKNSGLLTMLSYPHFVIKN